MEPEGISGERKAGATVKRRLKKALKIAGLAVGSLVLVVVGVLLYVYFHKPTVKNYLEKTLSKKPGLTVAIGRLDYGFFPLRVEAADIKISLVSELGKAQVVLGKAEAAGVLGRVIGDHKPYLDSLALSGLKIEFDEDPNAPSSGLKIRKLTRMISDYMAYVRELDVRDVTLRISLPAEGMDMAASGVGLKASQGDRTSVTVTAENFDFRNVEPAATLSSAVKLEASWPLSGPFALEGSLDLAASAVSLPGEEWEGPAFGLKLDFRGDEKTAVVNRLDLDIPDLLAVQASGSAELGESRVVSAASRVDLKNIELAKKTFAAFLPPGASALTADGGLQWEGDIRGELTSGKTRVIVNGTLRLPASHVVFKQGALSWDQTLRAELKLEGEPPGLRVSGFLEGSQGRLRTASVEARGLSFRLPFEAAGSLVDVDSLMARADQLVLSSGTEAGSLKLAGLSLGGSAKIDYLKNTARAASLSVKIPNLGDVSIKGEAQFGPKPVVSLSLRSQNIDLGRALESFAAFVPPGVSAWQLAGSLDLSADLENGSAAGDWYRVKGEIAFSKLAFQDASGTIVSEGLEPRLTFQADVPVPGGSSPSGPIPLSLGFELAKGESLFKDAYFNWQADPVSLGLKGDFEPAPVPNESAPAASLRRAEAVLKFAPLGSLRAAGEAFLGAKPRLDLHLSLPSIDLAAFAAFWGKMRAAQASDMEVSGRAEAAAEVRYDGSFDARGSLGIKAAGAKRKDGSLEVSGIEAVLPFDITNDFREGAERSDDFIAKGFLQAREIKTAPAVLGPLRLDFYSARNLFLLYPLELKLWGAELGLGQTVLSVSPVSLGLRGVSTMRLSELDFSRLPFNSESFKLTGTASIPEDEVEITPREFRFDGRLVADIFGGHLTMDRIRVAAPFSPARRIMFEAEIDGLDLAELTDSVPFGEVTGIVDISIQNMAVSYGQPESFALTIRSVPAKGVPQKFSLKAVDNLSVISSGGQSAAPSNSFFTRLVHRFNYSRIGIACSLENDVFTLRGTIVENGVQYLVRRATFFGIDVVNAKPVNTISFKDMLGRLERVGQSQEKK
jgi:hypothetical protein